MAAYILAKDVVRIQIPASAWSSSVTAARESVALKEPGASPACLHPPVSFSS